MRKWLLVGSLVLVFFVVAVLPVMAQVGTVTTNQAVSLRYSVKFVCGVMDSGTPDAYLPLARGRYHTSINVHNPSLTTKVTFGKKVAVSSSNAFDEGDAGLTEVPVGISYAQEPGPVSKFYRADLGPNESFLIDCQEIRGIFNAEPDTWMKGFVVIMSPAELDVTAVYAGRPTGAGGSYYPLAQVKTLDVEAIQPRPQRATIQITAPAQPQPSPRPGPR